MGAQVGVRQEGLLSAQHEATRNANPAASWQRGRQLVSKQLENWLDVHQIHHFPASAPPIRPRVAPRASKTANPVPPTPKTTLLGALNPLWITGKVPGPA